MSSQCTSIVIQVRGKQHGAALLIMLVILVVAIAAVLVNSLTSSTVKTARQESTSTALAQAKDALIGDTISLSSVNSVGYLRLPDLGATGATFTEGISSAPPNFTGNNKDYSVIGKVPWKTLGISPSRDGQGECIWYVVSGRFKNYAQTDTLNWDTLGQIDVIDGNGNAIASNIAALLVAPGQPIDAQIHTLSNPVYTQCGGNYDVRNYLDAYNSSDAISGEVNYFTGSTNNRVALNASNKRFVLAKNDHYNDQFLFVTTDDVFRPITRRSDFSSQISALMNDTYFQSVVITGSKGTASVICSGLSTANQTFCANWLEMLLLKPTTGPCSRVLIFGGKKTATQVRLTATDKSNPANYLEAPNLAAFAAPASTSNNFSGSLTFDANNPGADLLRCLP
jgi:hypothetical protein